MKAIEPILQAIYDAEIPCRIEWVFDGGFTWSLIGSTQYPRTWLDDATALDVLLVAESVDHMITRNEPLLEKDWIARGCSYSLHEAVQQLAIAVMMHYPGTASEIKHLL
jgi:hypothetical protein